MATEEFLRPRSCGKTNHIQWVRFRFATLPARQKRPGWAATKRSRSKASAAVNASPGCVSHGESEYIGRFLPKIPLPAKTARHRHDIRCRSADHVDLAVVQ